MNSDGLTKMGTIASIGVVNKMDDWSSTGERFIKKQFRYK